LARIREPVVAGLDADDVWFPEEAERQIAQLSGEPAVDGVFCHATVFAHGARPDPWGRSHALWGRSAPSGASCAAPQAALIAMIRAAAFSR